MALCAFTLEGATRDSRLEGLVDWDPARAALLLTARIVHILLSAAHSRII